MLLDSNIIIYAAMPEYLDLRDMIRIHSPKISVVSKIEVLGYHRLANEDKLYFTEFFDAANLIAISDNVIGKAIDLRQKKSMSIGDSLIAATCLVHNLKLITRNVDDFSWIEELGIINPFSDR